MCAKMPVKKIWLNLPVKDIQKSKVFFNSLGFSTESEHGNTEYSLPMTIGDNKFTVMLFTEENFHSFTRSPVANTSESTEVLISLDAESREEVDEYARKVEAAGGNLFAPPEEHDGWMYGCRFADLDGHRWNFLHMDFTKLTTAK